MLFLKCKIKFVTLLLRSHPHPSITFRIRYNRFCLSVNLSPICLWKNVPTLNFVIHSSYNLEYCSWKITWFVSCCMPLCILFYQPAISLSNVTSWGRGSIKVVICCSFQYLKKVNKNCRFIYDKNTLTLIFSKVLCYFWLPLHQPGAENCYITLVRSHDRRLHVFAK